MSILDILNELEATSSRLAKDEILNREVNNTLLKKVIVAALSPDINYWVAAIPSYVPTVGLHNLDEAIDNLSVLTSRAKTGNDAIDHLTWILQHSGKEAEVIERIIKRDLRCGVAVSSVNKVWNNLVSEFPVMLASADCKGIKFPAICQTKEDGVRVNLLPGTQTTVYTRNGKFVETHGVFDEIMKHYTGTGPLDGELLCRGKDGKLLDRKTGNGIINKAVRGTITKEEAEMLCLVAWDIVDFSGVYPYTQRLGDLKDFLKTLFDKQVDTRVLLIESEIVETMEAAQFVFEKNLARGKEGCILKNLDGKWENKRSKNLGKLKAELTADLRVVSWVGGEGKYAGKLGALLCESEDHSVRVSVGTGWSDEDRDNLKPENTLDRIVEVLYNARISKKGGGVDSLFLPRAIQFRDDRSTANISSDIK